MAIGIAQAIIEYLLARGEASIDELSRIVRATREVILSAVNELPGVVLDEPFIRVLNKLLLASHGVRAGLSLTKISRYVNWRDFEKLSALVLSEHGYVTATNISITRPKRLEVDVIGVDPGSGISLVIDCKHWSHSASPSRLFEAAERHLERTIQLLKYRDLFKSTMPSITGIKHAYPIIITLTTPAIRTYGGCVIALSIGEFNNFLADFHEAVELLEVRPIDEVA
ncbi:MAG: hypothetical protein N3E36_04330 [Sulfolobales archaeon]|nr:hypothetical protein [Sulfolobales archaeon]MCX8199241.1 hypothetical protein [Sulfolobales archaeon]MDW8170445.1 hypothetical protein [Desulfurococcaceae archaeon]